MEGTWHTRTGKVVAIDTIAMTKTSIVSTEMTDGNVAASVPSQVALAITTEGAKTIGMNGIIAGDEEA